MNRGRVAGLRSGPGGRGDGGKRDGGGPGNGADSLVLLRSFPRTGGAPGRLLAESIVAPPPMATIPAGSTRLVYSARAVHRRSGRLLGLPCVDLHGSQAGSEPRASIDRSGDAHREQHSRRLPPAPVGQSSVRRPTVRKAPRTGLPRLLPYRIWLGLANRNTVSGRRECVLQALQHDQPSLQRLNHPTSVPAAKSWHRRRRSTRKPARLPGYPTSGTLEKLP